MSPDRQRFVQYLLDFYGEGGLYPLRPALQRVCAEEVTQLVSSRAFYLGKGWDADGIDFAPGRWYGDSVDREAARDALISFWGYAWGDGTKMTEEDILAEMEGL